MQYFLYNNDTYDVSYQIEDDVRVRCTNGYQLEPSQHRMESIAQNIQSNYMFISEIYVIFLMMLTFVMAVIYVPFRMKEHDIPIILRQAGSNTFYDLMIIRIMFFICFMVLSGALPHLTMYHLDDECLHTTDADFFGINFTDFY